MLALVSMIIPILLAMVSFAAGITLAAKQREYPVAVVDLLGVIGLWLFIFWVRPQFSHLLLLLVTLGVGILVGYVVGVVRLAGHHEANVLPKSELPAHAQEQAVTAVSPNLLKRAWQRWNDFAGRMGNVQGRLLMGVFYFVFVTPLGLGVRLFSDPLTTKKQPTQSNWQPKEASDLTLEAAREQG